MKTWEQFYESKISEGMFDFLRKKQSQANPPSEQNPEPEWSWDKKLTREPGINEKVTVPLELAVKAFNTTPQRIFSILKDTLGAYRSNPYYADTSNITEIPYEHLWHVAEKLGSTSSRGGKGRSEMEYIKHMIGHH